MLTPFDHNGRVNKKVLAELIEYNIQKGVSGFYVGGSTAEAFLLTDEERNTVYETAAEAVNGRATLIAHVGTISTEAAVRFAETAKKCGYDAISAIAPFYYKFSFADKEALLYDSKRGGNADDRIQFPEFFRCKSYS